MVVVVGGWLVVGRGGKEGGLVLIGVQEHYALIIAPTSADARQTDAAGGTGGSAAAVHVARRTPTSWGSTRPAQ